MGTSNISKGLSDAKERDRNKIKPKLEEILKKLNRFRWQKYLKDYTGDYNCIKSTYWNLVYNDIVGRDDLNDLSLHIAKSYLGIFFWPHRCYQDILNLFDEMEFYQLELHRQLWDQWKAQVLEQRAQAISNIVVVTHRDPSISTFITVPPIGQNSVGLGKFDHYYIQKTPAISKYLKVHMRPGMNWFKDNNSSEIILKYQLDPALINMLHAFGEEIAKTNLLYYAFSRVEEQAKEYLSSTDKLKTVSSRNAKELHIAIQHLITNPDYRDLSLSQMKHIVKTLYVDQDGNPFKDNTISKALRSKGYSN